MRPSIYALLFTAATAAPLHQSAVAETAGISHSLQNILDNTDGSDLYTYPTDLTRGIVPKPIHSHNDYWRDLPFWTALSVGCISIEADVWLYNGTLYVGHERSALSESRTFESLYINPIMDVLNRENPSSAFVTGRTKNGLYDGYSGRSVYLWVDVKTDGPSTFPVVVQALQPLRDAGYLTVANDSRITSGPITVIGTGNTPLDQIEGVSPRDYFFDADLALLNTTQVNITSDISPIASTQFSKWVGPVIGGDLNDTQLALIQAQLQTAAARGIKGRYWSTPAWPISTRNAVWTTLLEQGVGLINADDLESAAGFSGINGYW